MTLNRANTCHKRVQHALSTSSRLDAESGRSSKSRCCIAPTTKSPQAGRQLLIMPMPVKPDRPLSRVLLEAGSIRFRPNVLTALATMIRAVVILFNPLFQGMQFRFYAAWHRRHFSRFWSFLHSTSSCATTIERYRHSRRGIGQYTARRRI